MTGRMIAKHSQMTQRDLNCLRKWVDDLKAASTIRTNDEYIGGTPTQLNFKQSVAPGIIIRHIINVNVHGTGQGTTALTRYFSVEQQNQTGASSSTL